MRDLVVSDIHIGLPGSRSGALRHALNGLRGKFSRLILAGDIFHHFGDYSPDDWNLLFTLTTLAQDGVELIVIPGNHDEALFADQRRRRGLGFLQYARIVDYYQEVYGGRRVLITHGHLFDRSLNRKTWIGMLEWFELRLRRWNTSHSILQHIKKTSAKWQQACREFSERAAREARMQGVDAIICGHTHQANWQVINNVVVGNVGSWVDLDPSLGVLSEHGFELHYFGPDGKPLGTKLYPIAA